MSKKLNFKKRIDKNSRIPIYKQVESILKEYILETKALKPDMPIPKERELAEVFKIQRLTVRHAIQELVSDGLLYKIRGKGTFVKDFTKNNNNNKNIAVFLPSGRSDILINPISWFVSFDIFRGITKSVDSNGHYVSLIDIKNQPGFDKIFFNAFQPKKYIGVIIIAYEGYETLVEKLKKMDYPYVVAGALKKDLHTNKVYTDIEENACNAVKYLIDKGHKNIGFINGRLYDSYFQERHNGYLKALYLKNIPIDNDLIIECDGGIEDGYNAMKELLNRNKKITAVFAGTDLKAIGSIRAMKERGIKIPSDISIVGYDDIKEAKLQEPSLTTVYHPSYEQGIEAVKLLLDVVNKKVDLPVSKQISGKLVIRSSVR